IGAGHTVTAIYEIVPVGGSGQRIDPLRYGNEGSKQVQAVADGGEYAFLKLRYKLPKEDKSRLISRPVSNKDEVNRIEALSNDFRFATAVAAFGQILKGGKYTGNFSYDQVVSLAQGAKGDDPYGRRAEFISMVRLAGSLDR
ncbi:YfbK domain-containing protein, partial [Magnetococcales bacterium HHB-1]